MWMSSSSGAGSTASASPVTLPGGAIPSPVRKDGSGVRHVQLVVETGAWWRALSGALRVRPCAQSAEGTRGPVGRRPAYRAPHALHPAPPPRPAPGMAAAAGSVSLRQYRRAETAARYEDGGLEERPLRRAPQGHVFQGISVFRLSGGRCPSRGAERRWMLPRRVRRSPPAARSSLQSARASTGRSIRGTRTERWWNTRPASSSTQPDPGWTWCWARLSVATMRRTCGW